MKCVRNFKWIASSMDEDLHCARDLFCDLGIVRSLLGSVAPYAKPLLSSRSLQKDIGFKTKVSHSDALLILNHWTASRAPFNARMDQMCKFYTFLSEGAAHGEINIKRDFVPLCSIFTPLHRSRSSDLVTGIFMSSKELYWHDPTGCSEMTDTFISIKRNMFPRRMLSATYPSLHEFFTEICGVPKIPTTSDYLEILLQLSSVALLSQIANHVFRVFVRWANDLYSGSDKMNDILYLKESLQKLETTVLAALVDKWVSLHPSFGLVCWADDDELKQQFKNSSEVEFIQFGELSLDEKHALYGSVAALMKILGIPALSKESIWSFSSSFVAEETVQFQPPYEPSHILKRKRNPGIISSHPPSSPKTAPDLRTSHRSQQEIKVNDIASSSELSKPVECGHTEDASVPVKHEGDRVVKEDSTTENMLVEESTMEVGDEPACLDLATGSSPNLVDETELTDVAEKLADVAEEKDNLDTGATDGSQLGAVTPGEAAVRKPDEQSTTGRLGEAAVHQYLVGQLGSSNVKWVNEESESGLPYDIVITPEDGAAEYVEVNATVSSRKDWFHITHREWQFALEKGDSFSIAHVLLTGSDKASIVMLKNPHKLCQQKVDLNLALVMSRKLKTPNFSFVEA